jgi:hypothetical protein
MKAILTFRKLSLLGKYSLKQTSLSNPNPKLQIEYFNPKFNSQSYSSSLISFLKTSSNQTHHNMPEWLLMYCLFGIMKRDGIEMRRKSENFFLSSLHTLSTSSLTQILSLSKVIILM